MTRPNPFPFTVTSCASCGEEHVDLPWHRFNYRQPLQYGLLYWAMCPSSGQPTFLVSAADPPGSEYGVWSNTHGNWLIDPTGLIFHTTSKDMAFAQMELMRRSPVIASWEVRRFGDVVKQAPAPMIVGVEGERPS